MIKAGSVVRHKQDIFIGLEEGIVVEISKDQLCLWGDFGNSLRGTSWFINDGWRWVRDLTREEILTHEDWRVRAL